MVGPAADGTDDEAILLLKIGGVTLVGASAGLVTLSSGGSLVQVGIAVVAGLVVGAVLLAYLVRIGR